MIDVTLFGQSPRVVGNVRNIDRTRDSADISSFGSDGVEHLDFDLGDLSEANVVTSISGDSSKGERLLDVDLDTRKGYHRPVLDLDVPAFLVPSSTPGHSHLYIDRLLNWDAYRQLLTALGRAGIIEDGYVGASIARGHTAVRLPWVPKGRAA